MRIHKPYNFSLRRGFKLYNFNSSDRNTNDKNQKMIGYVDNLDNILPQMLIGFFVEFSRRPSSEKLFEMLNNSEYKILALDTETNKVAGFINAISDHTLSAYIPLLEVLPAYRKQGIGKELVKRMIEKLKDYYMIDLCCDERMIKFYRKFGMKKMQAMSIRNYDNQIGKM
jgi:ribosomal protein S18 acetylase RimI-like enzyme